MHFLRVRGDFDAGCWQRRCARRKRGDKDAEAKRKVIIDQDCAGPGGTDMQAVLALVQSPDTDVLGITVVTGDAWLAEEVQHTLRLMEIIGRTDIPVVPGAAFPLVNTKDYIARWETLHGKVVYQGAWNYRAGRQSPRAVGNSADAGGRADDQGGK